MKKKRLTDKIILAEFTKRFYEARAMQSKFHPREKRHRTISVVQKGIDIIPTGKDYALSLSEFSARYLMPAAWALAIAVKPAAKFAALELPKGTTFAGRDRAIRMLTSYSISMDQMITRFDALVKE